MKGEQEGEEGGREEEQGWYFAVERLCVDRRRRFWKTEIGVRHTLVGGLYREVPVTSERIVRCVWCQKLRSARPCPCSCPRLAATPPPLQHQHQQRTGFFVIIFFLFKFV